MTPAEIARRLTPARSIRGFANAGVTVRISADAEIRHMHDALEMMRAEVEKMEKQDG